MATVSRIHCPRCERAWAWYGAHEFAEGLETACLTKGCWGSVHPAGWLFNVEEPDIIEYDDGTRGPDFLHWKWADIQEVEYPYPRKSLTK